MAYVRCGTKKAPAKKKQGLIIFRPSENASFLCYIGGYPLYRRYSDDGKNNILYVTIGGVESSVTFASHTATGTVWIKRIYYVHYDTIIIYFETFNADSTIYPTKLARYVTLRPDNTLFQSAAFTVTGTDTATTYYNGSINRQFSYNSGEQIAIIRSTDVYNSAGDFVREDISFFQAWWNPASGAVSVPTAATSLASGYNVGTYSIYNNNGLSIYRYNNNNYDYYIYGASNYQSANRNLSYYDGYKYTIGKLNDGKAVSITDYNNYNNPGLKIGISNISFTSTTYLLTTIKQFSNIIEYDSISSYYNNVMVYCLVNNIITFQIYQSATILGIPKPAGFYRIKINKDNDESYSLELMDDFAEINKYANGYNTHPRFWGPDSDPFNGVFIYDIDE